MVTQCKLDFFETAKTDRNIEVEFTLKVALKSLTNEISENVRQFSLSQTISDM